MASNETRSGFFTARKLKILALIALFTVFGALNAPQIFNKGLEKAGANYRVPEIPFSLGLDLLGGAHLVYKADVSNVPDGDIASALEGARDVIERRVNVFGVSEPIVQTSSSGDNHNIIVELAGVKDINQAITMIGETPILEFKEQGDKERKLSDAESEALAEFNSQSEKTAQTILDKLKNGDDFKTTGEQYATEEPMRVVFEESTQVSNSTNVQTASIASTLENDEFNADLKITDAGYEFVYLKDKQLKTDPFNEGAEYKEVKASHILICFDGNERCESKLTRNEAYSKIKSIQAQATTANFKELAKKYSSEPNADQTGGELGWFSRGMMVKPFEDTVFDNQSTSTISYIVETKFGFHLIYKEDERTVEEYNISRIVVRVLKPSDITGGAADWINTELTGKYLQRASVQFNQTDNAPVISLEFNSDGARLFEDITGRNIGRPVAIFLDGYPISVPTVNDKIAGGKAIISGTFTVQEAKLLAQRLNAGALPLPINLESQTTVGATLGQESLANSLKAGIIGIIIVSLFMIVYYRLPGLFAVIALILYGLIVAGIFKFWPVTLTLAGLAGFILSFGMAVDANILIFERLREELRAGLPLNQAIHNGFKRAWPSIRDGNLSTLLTCLILIQFTTSIVKGFALTLSIGIIISMFSAVVITKNLLKLVENYKLPKRLL